MSSSRASFLLGSGLFLALGTAAAHEVCTSVGGIVTELRPNASELLAVPDLDFGTRVTLELSYVPETQGSPEGDGVTFQIPDLRLRLVVGDVASKPGEEPGGQAFLIDSPEGLGADSLAFGGRVQFSGTTVLVSLQLENELGVAFDEAALPEFLDLSFFTRATLVAKTLPGDSRSLLFSATLDFAEACRAEVVTFRRAETDGDGSLTLSDAVLTLLFLFRGEREPSCMDAADTNDDGTIDLSDPVRTLLYLFNGAAPPPPPSSCGADPTDDGLDCKAFEVCA